MIKPVLLRHGESTWNRKSRFAGWIDVNLSEEGVAEARRAGRILKRDRYAFDLCFTSYLKRAIRMLWLERHDLTKAILQPSPSIWRRRSSTSFAS
jgi:2,3-bisphosphoglycerate-dependent phosphoglycerate mutase